MADGKLNALAVERAHKQGKPVMLSDGGGLYFRKQTATGSSWVLRYKFAGKPHMMTLGNYPDMPLAEARKQSRAARVILDTGSNPLQKRRADIQRHRIQCTLKQLAKEWFDAEVKGAVKHPEIQRRHLDNHWLPVLGNSVANDVQTADVTAHLRKVKKTAPTTANDLLRCIQRIYSYGLRNRLATANPVAALTTALDAGGTEKPRKRALSRQELESLLKAMPQTPEFGVSNTLAVKLLLVLCVRKRELLGAKWQEFDLDGLTEQEPVWRLRGGRTKTGDGIDIPLPAEAVKWLMQLRVIAGNSEYVFPKRRHAKANRFPHVGVDTLNAALRSVQHRLEPFTVHDLRRTARTLLASLGVSSEVAERCLNHKLKGVEGTYNTHDYFVERRRALKLLAALVSDLEMAKPKVVPLRRA